MTLRLSTRGAVRRSTAIVGSIVCLLAASCARAETALAAQSRSQEQRIAVIENAIDAKRKVLGVPGVALVIVKDDRIIAIRGFGYRNVAERLPVTPDTLFAIGSSTKAFTALSVLLSKEDGKLSLNDSPKKYLPYFKLQDPEAGVVPERAVVSAEIADGRLGQQDSLSPCAVGRRRNYGLCIVAADKFMSTTRSAGYFRAVLKISVSSATVFSARPSRNASATQVSRWAPRIMASTRSSAFSIAIVCFRTSTQYLSSSTMRSTALR